jgi:serine/threonine protein kinase/tetratricopeptide (TPR) repeat protein
MTPDLWERLKPLYHAALEIPEEERANFISNACGDDPQGREELAALLKATDKSTAFSDSPIISLKGLFPRKADSFSVGALILDRFRIVRHLGTGGMGDVYEATDLELGRIALKTIRAGIANSPDILARFRKEVQLARKISGPHVCRIHELFVISGDKNGSPTAFLTMEFLDGITLADRLRQSGPLPWREAQTISIEICEGLQMIHEAGIIHRDLKCANIMLASRSGSTCAVLMDFGLAREFSNSTSTTRTNLSQQGLIIGTPNYMAPEQFEGKELSPATDIYALGIVMYELVTGEHPFAASTPIGAALLRGRLPQPASSIQAGLPRCCDEVICKCLEFAAEQRYQTAKEVAEELRGQPFSFASLRRQVGRFSRNQLFAAAVLVSICIALALNFVRLPDARKEVSIPFAERGWILVSDFTNQTGEKVFDGTVRDLVTQSLSQSSYINVVPRLTALEAAKRIGLKDLKTIDSNLGRELCLRENYNALIAGEILKDGSKYVIRMRVELPEKGQPVISESIRIGSSGEIYSSVDRLVSRIRLALGESLPVLEKRNKPLAQVTTPSLEALQRYSAALDHYGAREYTRCIALANDAIELDANFAMAHLLLARAYEQVGDELNSRAQFQVARAGLDHVGEREKHLILAADYSSQEMNDKAADEYQHLLDIYPDDVDSLRGFAESSYWAGRPDQAIASQRKALMLTPNDVGCYDTLMTLLLRTNQFGETLAVYEQARSHKLVTTNLTFLAALAVWGNEDLRSARRMLDSLDDGTSDYWKVVNKLYLGKLLGYQGHLREALAAFHSGLALVERPGWENWIPVFQYQVAKAELVRGGSTVAKIECRKYGRIATLAPNPENLQRAAWLSLAINDIGSARRFQHLLERRVVLHPDAFSEMELYTLTGDIDLATGHTESAIQNQEKALAFHKGFEPYLALGEACERSRNWNCATEAYANYLHLKGEILRDDVSWDFVIANYSLSRVYFRSGNRALALQAYNEFLALFASADTTLPVLADSRDFFAPLAQEKPKP